MDNLNEKIYRILSWERYNEENITAERIASEIYEDIMGGGGDDIDAFRSGSYKEKTNVDPILIDERIRKEISDMDYMFVFKTFQAGTKDGLRSFFSLVLDNISHLELEKRYDEMKKKQLTWLFTPQEDCLLTRYSLLNSIKFYTVLEVDNTDCSAGYVRLFYTRECQALYNIMHPYDSVLCVFSQKNSVIHDNKQYLSNARFKQDVASVLLSRNDKQSNDGPSLDDSNDSDIVPALRSPYWPKDALQMITRTPKSGVPTNELKAKLLLKGCLMVAVGHKLSPNRDIEWRYSFSECEAELCHSWNYIQLHSYVLLKILKSEYFSEGLISSYHIKTCMFWSIEWFDQSSWTEKNLLRSIENVLEILIDFLNRRCLPNYFIEENNMVSHFDEQDFIKIINILQDVKLNVGQYIWKNIFRNLHIEPFDKTSEQYNERSEDIYDWNDLRRSWILMRLPRASVDAVSCNVKFNTYMRIVPEIKKVSDNVFTKNVFIDGKSIARSHNALFTLKKWINRRQDKI